MQTTKHLPNFGIKANTVPTRSTILETTPDLAYRGSKGGTDVTLVYLKQKLQNTGIS
jgi:hypothetical protein